MPKCGNCALRRQQDSFCIVFNEQVGINDSACRKYSNTIYKCSICSSQFAIGPEFTILNNEVKTICPRCATTFGSCPTCIKTNECLFESDPSSEPKFISKITQRNNMKIQGIVKNPSRIEKLCKNCQCFNSLENICQKENNNSCINFEMRCANG